MLRRLSAMGLLCLSCSVLEAQHLSPLFGVLASHSSLQRPKLFQQLQDGLPDYIKGIEPGLRMPFLDANLRDFESKIYNSINAISVEAEGDKLIIKNDSSELIKIDWSTKKFTNIITGNILGINADVKALLWRVVAHINDPILRKYAYAIKDAHSNSIDSLLIAYLTELSKETTLKTAEDIAKYIKEHLKDFRERLIQALHIAQSEFNEVVAQASNYFLSGNIGLALTNGEGAFTGGILLGIKSKYVGGAVFTNLIGSSIQEEKKPGISQLGLRGYITCSNVEIDIFYSLYLGANDSTKKDFHSCEAGAGVSFRLDDALTVGIAGTRLRLQDNDHPSYNLGILLNGVSQYLPTFVVGIGYQKSTNSDTYPIFQIIQPINAR